MVIENGEPTNIELLDKKGNLIGGDREKFWENITKINSEDLDKIDLVGQALVQKAQMFVLGKDPSLKISIPEFNHMNISKLTENDLNKMNAIFSFGIKGAVKTVEEMPVKSGQKGAFSDEQSKNDALQYVKGVYRIVNDRRRAL